MRRPTPAVMTRLRRRLDGAWRDPATVVSQWESAGALEPELLRHTVRGTWWETLARLRVTLLVSREYEHLLLAMRCDERGPSVTYLPLPHPSGLAVDRRRGLVHVASTRNPNQVYDLMVALPRAACNGTRPMAAPLVPVRTRFYPGSLYLHDLALVGGQLHANAVGSNAVIRLEKDGRYRRAWWPRCIETPAGPAFDRNHLQLNSIAAGGDLRGSFFSASTATLSARRPGHRNFPVDGRGVIFSGATREPVVGGLTRPHSARLRRGRLWVDNSGYGEVGLIDDGKFAPVARLPGWTRGLCFREDVAFVGTSRVLPRFRHYAPGLDERASWCGVSALDLRRGTVLGSVIWPYGNQVFAVEWLPASRTTGFPFNAGSKRAIARERRFFYAYHTGLGGENSRHA